MPFCDPRVVRVSILGKEYAFASPSAETDQHILQVAQLVEAKIRQVQAEAGAATPMQTAVVAGLELVDELLRLRREVSVAQDNIAERTDRLTESLGRLFREAAPVRETPGSSGESA